jgi:hypothetical protein
MALQNQKDYYDDLNDIFITKVQGEHLDDCALCPWDKANRAVKEITYRREYAGVIKTFKELVCQDCWDELNETDPEYFLDKTIISIKDV